jgi:hypothetical protein
MRHFDSKRRGTLTRYAQILHVSYDYGSQEGIFGLVRSYYPEGTRFVVLPMDMELMNAGKVKEPIDVQHEQLAALRDKYSRFTDPDAYVPILDARPTLKLCLAHFGGAGDWGDFLDDQWDALKPTGEKSWLAKVMDIIKSEKYPNLYTDIAYTIWADDEYVYLLQVLLSNEVLRRRVLFGSDFYVVESAELEERRRAVRVRAVLARSCSRRLRRTTRRSSSGRRSYAAAPSVSRSEAAISRRKGGSTVCGRGDSR